MTRSNLVQTPEQRLDLQADLAELARSARERIRAGGNPLARLTRAEIEASRECGLPEIISRMPAGHVRQTG